MKLIYMPEPNFELTARRLHDKDLNDALKCAEMLLPVVANGDLVTRPWAVMWAGHPGALALAAAYLASERWHRASGTTSARAKEEAKVRYFKIEAYRKQLVKPKRMVKMPPWFGLKEIHDSHKSYLARTRPDYYTGWAPDIPVLWPKESSGE